MNKCPDESLNELQENPLTDYLKKSLKEPLNESLRKFAYDFKMKFLAFLEKSLKKSSAIPEEILEEYQVKSLKVFMQESLITFREILE